MNKKVSKSLFLALISLLTGCSKDDGREPDPSTGGVLISTTVPAPDGMSGSAYMQLIPDMKEASYDNSRAIPASYTIPPVVSGKYVFDLPGASNESGLVKKYAFENGALVPGGTIQAPENSMPVDIVTRGNKAYVALRNIGQIWVINHETMTALNSIDLAEYGIGDKNPDPTRMIIRDNLLFVALQQIQGGYMPDPLRPAIDLLVIDLITERPLKMITEKVSGMTWPASATDQNSMFKDENNDIYVLCYGTMGMFNSGFLRIKNGEADFDADYRFLINQTAISGEDHSSDYLSSVVYHKNGKAYGVANIPAYFSNTSMPDYFKDRFSLPVEIDLAAKTLRSTGLPRSNGYGVVSGTYHDQVVFGLATENQNGYFLYDPVTRLAGEKAVVGVTGYPYKFYSFE